MQMQGERSIDASRADVWAALNDPGVLKACIPGCESLEKTSHTIFEATVLQKVGPVKARFKGSVELSDIVETEGYTITGEGKGGAAGFAKGGATVRLADNGAGTLLTYRAEAKVGGKIAQLGSRLIDGFARKMADDFFTRFQQAVEEPADESSEEIGKPEASSEPPYETRKGWFKRLIG
jgi:carbon monoxide dehydrogenase subunit G